MDHGASSSSSVLERLLKTNRPPTDEERAIIQDSLTPTNAELEAVEAQISDAMAHVQALKLQIEETEIKIQRLCQEKTALLEASADRRRVLSNVRNLPEDVIREIFIECVDLGEYVPTLIYGGTTIPYQLGQISSGMRHIALTTPAVWATMGVCVDQFYGGVERSTQAFSTLAAKASEWLDRAGGLDLYIIIKDVTYTYGRPQDIQSDPSIMILFNTILKYSTRIQMLQFDSSCWQDEPSPPIVRIASLTALDVPKLAKLVLQIQSGASAFLNSPILSIPTLRRLTLETEWDELHGHPAISQFPINWADLTSLTIDGGKGESDHVSSLDKIIGVLQQTKHLTYCDIAVRPAWELEDTLRNVNLSHLLILRVDDRTISPEHLTVFDLINAPKLVSLRRRARFLNRVPLANFLKRSPHIQELHLKTPLDNKESLDNVTELLHHCPSLYILILKAQEWGTTNEIPDANRFLRAFIEDGGDGVTCPRLQKFEFIGSINFSFQTLCRFLEAKGPGAATSSPPVSWKSVEIDMQGVDDSEVHQMSVLVSQKQAAGLNIRVHAKVNLLPKK